MAVHVSIHDVSPASAPELETALTLCAAVGARPALLVVPNFHGVAPLLKDARFCRRLRELQTGGHQVFLHGFFHRSRATYHGSGGRWGLLQWLFEQRVVSMSEAEMNDVSAERGRALVDDGERVLRDAGLRIDGYVAPAWSMPLWLHADLSRRGYRFAEDHLHVYNPASQAARRSVVLNWATRSPARLMSAVVWCRVAKAARALVPVRIAIHPSDMRFRLLRREVERLLAWAQGDIVRAAGELFA